MIHPSADISPSAVIGHNTRVWHRTQICDDVQVGTDCIIGSQVYIDRGVIIGSRVKIQTGAQLYRGATIEDGVFVGPAVCVTNDKFPRAITPDGSLKTDADWVLEETRIRYGASLGAGAIVLGGVEVGRFAIVAAGAVVTRNVPDYGLVAGLPARLIGHSCSCGRRIEEASRSGASIWVCRHCHIDYLKLPDNRLRPMSEFADDLKLRVLTGS